MEGQYSVEHIIILLDELVDVMDMLNEQMLRQPYSKTQILFRIFPFFFGLHHVINP